MDLYLRCPICGQRETIIVDPVLVDQFDVDGATLAVPCIPCASEMGSDMNTEPVGSNLPEVRGCDAQTVRETAKMNGATSQDALESVPCRYDEHAETGLTWNWPGIDGAVLLCLTHGHPAPSEAYDDITTDAHCRWWDGSEPR